MISLTLPLQCCVSYLIKVLRGVDVIATVTLHVIEVLTGGLLDGEVLVLAVNLVVEVVGCDETVVEVPNLVALKHDADGLVVVFHHLHFDEERFELGVGKPDGLTGTPDIRKGVCIEGRGRGRSDGTENKIGRVIETVPDSLLVRGDDVLDDGRALVCGGDDGEVLTPAVASQPEVLHTIAGQGSVDVERRIVTAKVLEHDSTDIRIRRENADVDNRRLNLLRFDVNRVDSGVSEVLQREFQGEQARNYLARVLRLGWHEIRRIQGLEERIVNAPVLPIGVVHVHIIGDTVCRQIGRFNRSVYSVHFV